MKPKTSYPHVVTEVFLCLAFSVFLLFPGLHGYQTIQDEKALAFYLLFGVLLALLSYCIQAFFGLSICLTAAFFWLLLGILNHKTRRKTT